MINDEIGGIGEMVSYVQINSMNDFITKHGEEAFKDAVFNHAFEEVTYKDYESFGNSQGIMTYNEESFNTFKEKQYV